jgi:ABC-type glycerol-3-phosphate transport system substrate-binding protein
MEWGVAPLPRDEVQFTTFWVEEGYAISSETQFPDESWKWINFLTWQINPRLVPARRSLVNSQAYNQLLGDDAALVLRQSLDFATPFSLWQWINLGGAMEAFDDAIEQVVEGDNNPQEALDQAQVKAKGQVP